MGKGHCADKVIVDGGGVTLCDGGWKAVRKLPAGVLPSWAAGANEITVKSDFSGEQAPVLKFDLTCMGLPEKVGGH